jgi:hypothetical protein
MGDLQAGRYIEMVEVTPDLFALQAPVKVRTVAETDIAVGLAGANVSVLEPVEDDEQGEDVWTRGIQTVPPAYYEIALSRNLTPVEMWRRLAGAIIADNLVVTHRPLLAWLQVAVTKVVGDDNSAQYPEIQLGDDREAFPAWRSPALQDFRRRTLEEDFPQWNRGEPTNEGRLTQMVEVMRREADRERAIRNADRLADKSSATPSEAFPWFSRRFLLLAGVDDEMDLPKIYHELASAKKAEARQCVSEIINARTLEPDSAGVSEVKVTKELFEMIKQGNLGSELEIDDLTKGVQPFTCGYGMGPASDLVSARIDAFDLTMAGEIRPSMVEELTFKTKEIVLPEEPFLFQSMLQATSVVIDVVQGKTHPHAIELRRFVITDIPRIIQTLVRLNSSGAGTGNVYPRLLREVQVRMNAYFSDLLQNLEPEPPTYTDIRRVIWYRKVIRPMACRSDIRGAN